MMALGALEALREQGIQVPDDVALIGSDNIPDGQLVYAAFNHCGSRL